MVNKCFNNITWVKYNLFKNECPCTQFEVMLTNVLVFFTGSF